MSGRALVLHSTNTLFPAPALVRCCRVEAEKTRPCGGLAYNGRGTKRARCRPARGEEAMVAIVSTTAYLGLEARAIEVQCQIAPGMPGFAVVGLPDKAVAESRERVRAALSAIGLALPPKRITVNLSPADLPQEGSQIGRASCRERGGPYV